MEKAVEEVKTIIFSVLFVLLKEEGGKSFIYIMLLGALDYTQILRFIFSDKIMSLWFADDVFDTIFNIFSIFNIMKYIGDVFNKTTFIIFFFVIISMILVILIEDRKSVV